jgi:hypothetical protein
LRKISNGLRRLDLPPLSSTIVDDMIAVGNIVTKLLLFVVDRDATAALKVGVAAIDLLNSFVAQNHGLLTTHHIDRTCSERSEWRAENLIAFFGSKILECVHRCLQRNSELSRIRPSGLDFFLLCSVCTESTYYSMRCLSELLKVSPLLSTMCRWDYRYFERGQKDCSGGGIAGQPNPVQNGGGGGGVAEERTEEGDRECSDAIVMDIDELMGRDSPFLLPPKGPQNGSRNGPRAEIEWGLGLPSGIAGARKEKSIANSRDKDAMSSSSGRGSSSSISSSRGRGRGSDGLSFAVKPHRSDSIYSSLISGTMDPRPKPGPGPGLGLGIGIGIGPTLDSGTGHRGDSHAHPAGLVESSRYQNSKFHCDPIGLQVPRSKFFVLFTDLRNAYLNLGELVAH